MSQTFTIRPGGISSYFVDFGQQEAIYLDGLTLSGTPTVSFDPVSIPPGSATVPTLGTPAIVTPSSQPAVTPTVDPYTEKVTGALVTSGGSGWPNAPATVWCVFTGGGGAGAVGLATVSRGAVTAVQIVNSGSGYTAIPNATFYSACVSVLVTTTAGMAGYTFVLHCICPLSDGQQNVQGEGFLAVSW